MFPCGEKPVFSTKLLINNRTLIKNDKIKAWVINDKNFSCINLATGSLKYTQPANVTRLITKATKPVKKIINVKKHDLACYNVIH